MERVNQLWFALQQVQTLEFVAQSRSNTGWVGKGTGSVAVESPSSDCILLQESGLWHPAQSSALHFRNTYRWRRFAEQVGLEHLRFGSQHPVYLFDLAPKSDTIWSSVDSHLCRNDHYTAHLEIQDTCILMHWKVIGPEKDEEILYRYYKAI